MFTSSLILAKTCALAAITTYSTVKTWSAYSSFYINQTWIGSAFFFITGPCHTLALYKPDTSLRWTVRDSPEGVLLREFTVKWKSERFGSFISWHWHNKGFMATHMHDPAVVLATCYGLRLILCWTHYFIAVPFNTQT